MKVERRAAVAPPQEAVITLNEREANLLAGIMFSGIAFDSTMGGTANPVGRFARELKDELSSLGFYGVALKSQAVEGYLGKPLVRLTEG